MLDEIIKELAIKYNKDIRVIKLICEHPLFFTKYHIADPNDVRPIMIRYLAKFVPKFGVTLEKKIANTVRHDKVREKYNKSISIATEE